MAHWQSFRGHLFRIENAIVLVLLLLAAFLVAPALRAFSPSPAERAKDDLMERIEVVQERARTEGRLYTIAFSQGTAVITVYRWSMGEAGVQEQVPSLSGRLLQHAVVESTNLPGQEITVSERGFILAQGEVTLTAPGGTRATLEIGGK